MLFALAMLALAAQARAGAVTVILGGQSNSNSNGSMLPGDELPDPLPIVVVTPEEGVRDNQEPWRKTGAAPGQGVGAGRSFARTLLAKDPGITQVWMIACGVGGSSITSWLPNLPGTHMDECIHLIDRTRPFDAPVIAVLWMQGEADSSTMAKASMYGARLKNVVNGFRTKIGSPDVPFLMTELADNVPATYMPYRHVVNGQARDMLATLNNTAWIDTSDLHAMRTDEPVHWERGPLRAIGNRLANALFEMRITLGLTVAQ